MHIALHNALGLCLWNVLAVIVLGISVVILAVHFAKQKQRKAAYEAAMASPSGAAPRPKK